MTAPEVGALVLAAVFGLGAVPKLIGVAQSREIAKRLDVGYGVFRLVGCCELAGALGLLFGVLAERWVGVAAATGLTLLAVSGCGAHYRAKEPWTAYLPAIVLGGCSAAVALLL